MNLKTNSLAAIFLLLPGFCLADAYIPWGQNLKTGGYRFFFNSEYAASQTRWDSSGAEDPFFEGEDFRRFQGQVAAAYGFTDHIQFRAGVRYRLNQSTVYDSPNSQYVALSNGGLESSFLEATIADFFDDRYYLGIQAMWRGALYANDAHDIGDPYQRIVLGDDFSQVSLGVLGSYLVGSNIALSGAIHYRDPGGGLSSEVLSKAELALHGRKLALVVGLENVTSLNNDDFSDSPSAKPEISRASTYLYNSVNRSWNDVYGMLQMKMGEQWRMEVGAFQRLSGRSTDALLGGMFNLTYTGALTKRDDDTRDRKFKNYEIQGEVEKVSPQGRFVEIDVGLSHGVKRGMDVDIYKDDYFGGNTLLATGIAYKVSSKSTIVKITKYFRQVTLEKSMVARVGSL